MLLLLLVRRSTDRDLPRASRFAICMERVGCSTTTFLLLPSLVRRSTDRDRLRASRFAFCIEVARLLIEDDLVELDGDVRDWELGRCLEADELLFTGVPRSDANAADCLSLFRTGERPRLGVAVAFFSTLHTEPVARAYSLDELYLRFRENFRLSRANEERVLIVRVDTSSDITEGQPPFPCDSRELRCRSNGVRLLLLP